MNKGALTRVSVLGVVLAAGICDAAAPAAAPRTPAQEITSSFTAVRGDRANGWPGQARSEVLGLHGMVATSQPLAAQAGLRILQQGGNAFDAAIATAAVINVVEPEATGIGGDMYVIAWSAKSGKLIALNGSGRSPTGMTPDYFKKKGLATIPVLGIDSAVVPGAVDGWNQLLKTYGTMTFKQVLEPAAVLAQEGFGVSERIGNDWQLRVKILSADEDSARVYLPGGGAPRPYTIFRNPDLAHALRVLQQKGRDAFYKGEIAAAIVAKSRRLGGNMTLEDLAATHATWETPITTAYHGYDVYEFPPNTQGFAVLEMLNILDACAPRMGFDIKVAGPRSPLYWHLLIEAKKLAYADLQRYGGDPDFSHIPVERLISKTYGVEQCAKIDPTHAAKPESMPMPTGGTAYIATADKEGNVVSFIYSIYSYFGSGVTVPGYGFLLNDRGSQFNLTPGSPNVIAPRKRPFQTLIPGFIMKDGRPLTAFGLMGGDQQAQGHAQVLVNMIDFGANIQAASDAARFNHNQRTNQLRLESQLYDLIGADMQALGHDVTSAGGAPMGGYQAITRDSDTGLLHGASDHRKDGMAAGW
ncbi:MAG TPA: gamma-glutamyltransferase [Steroidobacteraceae bacterium]